MLFLILQREKNLLDMGEQGCMQGWERRFGSCQSLERALECMGNGTRDVEIILKTSARYSFDILWKSLVNIWITLWLVLVVKLVFI